MRRYRDVLHRRLDPRGREYFWMAGEIEDVDSDDETVDTVAVRRGYVSVTPISFDLTQFKALDVIRSWNVDVFRPAPTGGTD